MTPETELEFTKLPPKSEFLAMPRTVKSKLVALALLRKATAGRVVHEAREMVRMAEEEGLSEAEFDDNLLFGLEAAGYKYHGEECWQEEL